MSHSLGALLFPIAFLLSPLASAADAPKLPPFPQKWQGRGVVVDDFGSGKFVGPFTDNNGSTISQDVIQQADGRGSYLLTRFKIVPGGNAGMWAKVGMAWDKKQDWTRATNLSLLICTSRPMDFMLNPKSGERRYTVTFSIEKPRQWQRVNLPLKTWRGIESGIGRVSDYDFQAQGAGEGWFALADIRIEGAADAAAQVPDEPKIEMNPKVIFTKTLIPPTERSSKTYIVDVAAPAAGADGSEAHPFKRIQQAADLVLPGDTVLIRNGTYREQTQPGQSGILITRSGAPDAWIRFAAYPGHQPKISSPAWATIRLAEVAYIEIDGLDVTTEVIANQTGDNKDRNSGNGIGADKSHHIRIRNCTAHDCGGGGIGTGYCDYITVENNRVFRNAFYSIYNCSGISLWEGRDLDDAPGYHNIIRSNISYENQNKGPTPLYGGQLTDGNGIILDWLRGKGAVLVENNLCYRNGGRGIVSTHSRNAVIRNNTVVGNDFTEHNSDLFAGGSTDVLFINNICVAAPGIKVSNRTWQSTNITYSHNLFYGYEKIDPPLGEGNIINQDPRLDPGTFRPLPGSPAIGAGDPAHAPSTDLVGSARPEGKPVTIGAFQ